MTTIKEAKAKLAAFGWTIRKTDGGDYRVAPSGAGNESIAYYSDDIADAVATALHTIEQANESQALAIEQIKEGALEKLRAEAAQGIETMNQLDKAILEALRCAKRYQWLSAMMHSDAVKSAERGDAHSIWLAETYQRQSAAYASSARHFLAMVI